MAFAPFELSFEPGLFGNRSRRASKQRWVDGRDVRFKDGVPAQIGGWQQLPLNSGEVIGCARDVLAFRPSTLFGRYLMIGTHLGAFLYDGGSIAEVTPDGFLEGRSDTLLGTGYGAGDYGEGDYGTPRSSAGVTQEATVWTFDLWGDVPIACYSYTGTIYDYEVGTDLKLQELAGAPSAAAVAVSDERHIFAFGANGDATMVMWCDRDDRTDWVPSTANRAGFYQMQNTTPFQCGRRCRGMMLAWTKTELFGFAPLGNALVYSRERLGSQCGAMGPHAVAVVTTDFGETAFWMAPHAFYEFDGIVREIPCDLRDYVFRDLNLMQRIKVQARTVKQFSEIWFFYVSEAGNEIDRCVIFNYEQRIWYKSSLARLVWEDQGVFDRPIAIDADGTVFEHEYEDLAEGEPIGGYVLSFPITIGAGKQLIELAAFHPDMEPESDACQLTVVTRDYAQAPDVIHGPFAFDGSTEKIDLSICGRQVQFKIEGTAGHWELGLPLIDVQTGGGR